jgi:hypothetical protein
MRVCCEYPCIARSQLRSRHLTFRVTCLKTKQLWEERNIIFEAHGIADAEILRQGPGVHVDVSALPVPFQMIL